METTLVELPVGADAVGDVTLQAEDTARLIAVLSESLSLNTHRNYDSAMRRYRGWCAEAERGYTDLFSPVVVAKYLAFLSRDHKQSSVDMALAAILDSNPGQRNLLRDNVGVQTTMRGVRRGQRGKEQKRARMLSKLEIRTMLSAVSRDSNETRAARDLVVLVLGLCLGCRASELCSLRAADFSPVDGKGYDVKIRCSKTSDSSVTIALPLGGETDACDAIRTWLSLLEKHLGAQDPELFLLRSVTKGGGIGSGVTALQPSCITDILRRICRQAGSVDLAGISSHTLRASYCSGALLAGFDASAVARSRWKNTAMVTRYDRRGRWENVSGSWLAL